MMSYPRSYLFVPGHRSDRFAKAAASGAHQIILDLEDAVGSNDKDTARQQVAQWFGQGGAGMVRINSLESPWFEADLAAAGSFPSAHVMVPKADAQTLARVAQVLPRRPLIGLVESVAGLIGIHAVASSPGVSRLAFGNLDFGTDARIPSTGPVLDPARFQIVMASRHAGLPPPIDGVTVGLQDDADLAADVTRARDLGFTAKLCIHPRQVERVNATFAPSQEEGDWARRIVHAVEESAGAVVQVDGKMVDRPVLERARSILAELDPEALRQNEHA
ncbi:HpcH/HpaI aldolase/citrate lyase family protein [Microvirga sp. P5_D2]